MHSALLGGGFVCFGFNNANRKKWGTVTLTISKDACFLSLDSRSMSNL